MSTRLEVLQLPKTLIEAIREKAKRTGASFEEYIIDILTQGLDQKESIEVCMDASRFLVEEARRGLGAGDFRHATGRLWSATGSPLYMSVYSFI